jgi:anti-sigma regulatory factor (Ser/Thr protein kinase)
MEPPRARWVAPATAGEVGRMRRAAATAAAEHGLAGRALEQFELAVSEALTNAVLHAYPGRSGPVSLELECDDAEIRATIADEGMGIRANDDHRGLGVGLGIMASAADFCEIRSRRGSGVAVMVGFELHGPNT